MKKRVFTILLAVSFLQIGFSQQSDNWERQMEEFQRRMQEMTEQLSKQFGSNGFIFDTAFVMPFDGGSFDGMNFPFDTNFVKRFEYHFDGENFDTSMMRGFQWFGMNDMPMPLDTLFFKEFKNFGGEDFPGFQFDGDWSKGMSEMMEQLMKQFENFGQEFGNEGQPFYFKERKSAPDDENGTEKTEPKPKPAPQKKRKTSTL